MTKNIDKLIDSLEALFASTALERSPSGSMMDVVETENSQSEDQDIHSGEDKIRPDEASVKSLKEEPGPAPITHPVQDLVSEFDALIPPAAAPSSPAAEESISRVESPPAADLPSNRMESVQPDLAVQAEAQDSSQEEEQKPEPATETGERVVKFKLAREVFGLDIYQIRSLVKVQDTFPVPNMPEYILGLTNLRGEIVPVIDLHIRLGLERQEYADSARFLVAEIEDHPICLVVDNVTGIEYFPPHLVETPSDLICGTDAACVRAIAKSGVDLVQILDLRQSLGDTLLKLGKD